MADIETWEDLKNRSEDFSHQYWSAFDFARAIAMTRFVEYMSKEFPDFTLRSCSPKNICNRDLPKEERTEVFVVGLWFSYSLGSKYRYIQVNENPFFDVYIIGHYFNDGFKKSTDAFIANDIFYEGVSYDCSEENVDTIYGNLLKIFKEVDLGKYCNTARIPYSDLDEQKIYVN